jgi:hypothetical protein
MENEQNIPKIIDEKNITEEDLYFLSHIEGIKSTAGIFKEKYNKYMYGILKKYNVNSIDFLIISRYVKNKKFHLVPDLIEKYGPYQLDNSKTSYDFVGMKSFVIVLIAIIVGVFVFKKSSNSSSNYQKSSTEGQSCIGNQGCISKVRENFTNTGKTILGEEYIGNGKFGISFMDSQHPGAFNATVTTDCNCNVLNVNVSTIR